MTAPGIMQIALYAIVLVALSVPLGAYMARVYTRPIGRCEERLYRLLGAKPEQTWREYAVALMVFNLLGIAVVYLLQRLQGHYHLDGGAVGVGNNFISCLKHVGIYFRHYQWLGRIHSPGRGIIDNSYARSGIFRSPLQRGASAGREQRNGWFGIYTILHAHHLIFLSLKVNFFSNRSF